MKQRTFTNSQIINGIALGFSALFLISAFIAAFYTGEWGSVFSNWYRILISPCPLVTDYFALGGLSGTMLNAGMCGMACFLAMVLLKGESTPNTLSGYFLVVAHCFYGLNFLNMWPCFLAPFLYFRLKKMNFKNNLHICMFATAFGPFISELLFRYTLGEAYTFGVLNLTASGITLAACFALILGFVVPAILPGVKGFHKGHCLYNAGLAFGLFGFFAFSFLYKTMGITPPQVLTHSVDAYERCGRNYQLYANFFFLIAFFLCLGIGYLLNGKTFRGYESLLKDTGWSSDFSAKYGMPVCLINIGIYGIFFLIYLNVIILLTPGAGFTGPTFGGILAALTFTAMGQHPKNIWPILGGYVLLNVVTAFFCVINGRDIIWTVSTQGYISAVAFATGLAPIVGRYGVRAGLASGFICASICMATRDIHGGFVLYNGGFTACITALIILPFLEHHIPVAREEIKPIRSKS